jgi:hypothetical protein
MSVLRTIEHKIEGLVDRTFRRAFRGRLQPVELARKLAREMDENKTVSVSKVYVPNEYTVYLSELDREGFASFEGSLVAELQTYLAAHAQAEGLSLLADPKVTIQTDSDLRPGEFGIGCRMADPVAAEAPDSSGAAGAAAQAAPAEASAEEPAEEASVPAQAAKTVAAPAAAAPSPAPVAPAAPARPPTRVYEPLAAVGGTQILSAEQARAAGLTREALEIQVEGRRHRVTKRVTTIGRSRECDIVVADPNVSRTHCELRHVGMDYFLVDPNSTNGVEVNGQKVKRHALAEGDLIKMGTTEMRVGRAPA